MIALTILYPKSHDTHFDMDYYATKHMPMFADVLGAACKSWGVIAPRAEYHAVGWVMIESQDGFNAAMAAHGAQVIGDVHNYTNTQPTMIMGDVVV